MNTPCWLTTLWFAGDFGSKQPVAASCAPFISLPSCWNHSRMMPQVMMKDGSSEKNKKYIVSIDVCWIHFFGQWEEITHYMWVKNVKFKVL